MCNHAPLRLRRSGQASGLDPRSEMEDERILTSTCPCGENFRDGRRKDTTQAHFHVARIFVWKINIMFVFLSQDIH